MTSKSMTPDHGTLSVKEYVALILKVPKSGTPWLDEMIVEARELDKKGKIEVKMSSWSVTPSKLEGRKSD